MTCCVRDGLWETEGTVAWAARCDHPNRPSRVLVEPGHDRVAPPVDGNTGKRRRVPTDAQHGGADRHRLAEGTTWRSDRRLDGNAARLEVVPGRGREALGVA